LRPETVLREGDKVIAIGRTECQELLHGQLIGDTEPTQPAQPKAPAGAAT
jgi:hypothetical protein